MGCLPLCSVGSCFLRAPGSPGKCEICDQAAETSWEKSCFLQQAWEVPAGPIPLEGEAPHAAWRFLLFLSESFRKCKVAALALLMVFPPWSRMWVNPFAVPFHFSLHKGV